MSEKHWDISEKDAEFFAELMGVSHPSDARPWHDQFLDLGWLVTKAVPSAADLAESDELLFPDLDLLSHPTDQARAPGTPGTGQTGSEDLNWIASLHGRADSLSEEGPPEETDKLRDEVIVPSSDSEELNVGAQPDALERLLEALVEREQQGGADEKTPSHSADVPQDISEALPGKPDRTTPEPPARGESLSAAIGADEFLAKAQERADIPEVSAETVEAPPIEGKHMAFLAEEEPPSESGEASSPSDEDEEGVSLDLSVLEETREAAPEDQNTGVEAKSGGRAPQPDEVGTGVSSEGVEAAFSERSGLVPEEWTDFSLREEGVTGGGNAQPVTEEAESDTVAGEDGAEAVEAVIGAAELNERVKVPWGDESRSEPSQDGDAFVELAVEQRIRRPGIFHRLALADTDRRLGLEIGKHHVIYTIVVRRRNRFELEGYGIIPVEALEDDEGETVEQVGLQKVLEQISSDRTIRQAYLAVADDGMETIIRRLELPKLSKKEMSEALRWALRKELPFDPDAAQVAHVFLPDKTAKKSRKVPVLAAAASKPEVESTVQRLRLSGFRVGALVAPSWALYRLFTRFQESDPETCQVLVHIGTLRSEILFVQEGQLLFQRTITTALDDFVSALTSTLFEDGHGGSLSRREAFALLRKYGIPEIGADGRTDTGLRLTEVAVSVRPVVEKLVNEVERSLDYFRQKFKTHRFGRLWLSGIGATVLHLGGVLESETRVPTEVFRPSEAWPSFAVCKGLSPEILEKHGPALVIPLGLATQKPEPLNLLPARYRHSSVVRLAQRGLAYGTLAALVAGGMTTANVVYKARALRYDVMLLEQQRLRLVKQQAELRKLRNERNALARELATYLQELPRGEGVSLYLKALSRLTPPTMALTSVELVPPDETAKNPNVGATEGTPTAVLRIQGIVFPDPPREGAHLAQFLLGLKQSGLFRSVRLENSRESDLPRVGLEFLAVGELR